MTFNKRASTKGRTDISPVLTIGSIGIDLSPQNCAVQAPSQIVTRRYGDVHSTPSSTPTHLDVLQLHPLRAVLLHLSVKLLIEELLARGQLLQAGVEIASQLLQHHSAVGPGGGDGLCGREEKDKNAINIIASVLSPQRWPSKKSPQRSVLQLPYTPSPPACTPYCSYAPPPYTPSPPRVHT